MSELTLPDGAVPSSSGATGARTRRPARVLLVARDAGRTFLVRPVRENLLRAHGGGLTAVVWFGVGIAAFAVAGAGVVLGPWLAGITTAGGAAGAVASSEPGTPLVVPAFFVPALFCLLLVGCSLALFGAALARPLTAAAALAVVVIAAGTPAAMAWDLGSGPLPRTGLVTLLVALAAIPVLRHRRPPLPVVGVFAAVAGAGTVVPACLTVLGAARRATGSIGGSVAYSMADTVVAAIDVLLQPVVFLAGAAAVGFGITVTAFLRRSAVLLTRSSVPALGTLVLILLAVRWVLAARSLTSPDGPAGSVGSAESVTAGVAAAAAVLLLAGLWWRWAAAGSRRPAEGSAQAQATVVGLLISLPMAAGILVTCGFLVSAVLDSDVPEGPFAAVIGFVGRDGVTTGWRIGLGALLLGWAVLRRVTGRSGPVIGWVGLVGGLDLVRWTWLWLAPAAASITVWSWNLVALAAVTAAACVHAIRRRRPSPDQVATAGAMLTLLALVQQGSFLADPFAPVLGFAGVGFVVFGVVWGFLTSGGHGSVRGRAGIGRSVIMLAYAVVPTTLLAWKQASIGGQLTDAAAGSMSGNGMAYLGDPLVLALLAAWLPVVLGLRRSGTDPTLASAPAPA